MSGDVGQRRSRRRRRKLRLSPDTREEPMLLLTSPISTNHFHVDRRDYNQAYYMGFDGGCKADAPCNTFKGGNIVGKCYPPSCGEGFFWCFKAMMGRALGFMRCTVGGSKENKQVMKKRRSSNTKSNVTTIKVNASPYVYDSHHAQAMEDCIEFVNSFYKDGHY